MRVTTKWDPTMTQYIGRPSVFGNPYPMRSEQDRELVIQQFERYARSNATLLQHIKALPKDAVLGCYCASKACHGDVIIKLWKEIHS